MARRGSILPGSATVTGLIVIMTVIDGKIAKCRVVDKKGSVRCSSRDGF